jgi:hypothetical protein
MKKTSVSVTEAPRNFDESGEAEGGGVQGSKYLDRGPSFGTQLIQDLTADGVHGITRYEPQRDKVMRMYSVTRTIENGFVHIPVQAYWLPEYLHELVVFPNGKYDDQADSTSQALDWFKNNSTKGVYGVLEYEKREAERTKAAQQGVTVPESMPCSGCNGVMSQRIPGGLRCAQCGAQWPPPGPPAGWQAALRRHGITISTA